MSQFGGGMTRFGGRMSRFGGRMDRFGGPPRPQGNDHYGGRIKKQLVFERDPGPMTSGKCETVLKRRPGQRFLI